MIDLSEIKYNGKDIRKNINLLNGPTPELAEIVGIMLGDGCLHRTKKGYLHSMIAFHKEELFYLNHVKILFESYFYPYIFRIDELKDEFMLRNSSSCIGRIMMKVGLIPGNKTKNKVKIPKWIFSNKEFLISVMRGLFDTDGCVYRKYDHYAQIQFKFGCIEILKSVREVLILLGFHPTKIQWEPNHKGYTGYKIYLSRQEEIDRFFEKIIPMNAKHVERFKKIRYGAVGIRTQINWYIPL